MLADKPEIANDVQDELDDTRFSNLQHYSRATYAKGCRGPLCSLREAHRGRQRTQARAEASGREYVPLVAARRLEREDELLAVATWHVATRNLQGIGAVE